MSASPLLQIKELFFSYPDGTNALENINLELKQGESIALLGPNGAGKSTLLLHLNGIFMSPQVKVAGLAATVKNLVEIRRKVGLIFQDPDDQLFSPTIYDDVAFGPLNLGYGREEIEKRVLAALMQVNLTSRAQKPPHHLSFGEKKRASIATVLSMSPDLLVLDEPTSNLDPANRRTIIELVRGLPMAKIIATHDLEMVLDLDIRTLILDQGTLVADGPAKQILADEQLLCAHSLELPWSCRLEKVGL